VQEGSVLVRLDARQERAQLAAAESQRNLTRLNLDRARGLLADGVVSQADFDRASAEHAQAEARVGEIRATIDRKEIRAPFSGLLGIRQVDLGDPVYVNFSVPQQEVPRLRVGGEVKVTAEGLGAEFEGRITALDSVVDPATRNVQIQATLPNPTGRLRPGMFVDTQVVLGATSAVVAVPASAISYAPYGDSVFVVSELKGPQGEKYRGVTQQVVKLGASRGDQVAVVSGLQAGQEIVTSGTFKLRNGAAVQVSDAVKMSNDPAPKPENN
jgi:membrane fusion protein (multidrug efflux system)